MCSAIAACSGGSEVFGAASMTSIGNYRDSAACLDTGGSPPNPDCNINCIADADEIMAGTSLDCNVNGIPDSCDISSGGIGSLLKW